MDPLQTGRAGLRSATTMGSNPTSCEMNAMQVAGKRIYFFVTMPCLVRNSRMAEYAFIS